MYHLGVYGMCVDDSALQVFEVRVVLQCPHIQASLLSQLGNAGPVIMGEGAIGKDSISDLQGKRKGTSHQTAAAMVMPCIMGMSHSWPMQ
jgi:hypothetical protein